MHSKAIVFAVLAAVLAAATVHATPNINCDAEAKTDVGAIRKHLLCKYDADYLPVKDKGPVMLEIKFLPKFLNYHDYNNMLSISAVLDMTWTDYYLKWNPDDYHGVKQISAESESIWQPNIAMHNNHVDAGETEICTNARCDVKSDGKVACALPCDMSSSCKGNVRRWPYDVQNCTVTFAAWIYNGNEVDYTVRLMALQSGSEAMQSDDWRILEHGHQYLANEHQNRTHPSFQFYFVLQRVSGMHALMVMTPAFVIMVLNIITLWLQPECTERLALICCNIFIQIFYLHSLSYYVPMNGTEPPLILIYFKVSLWLTVLLEVNAVVARGLKQLTSQPPKWLSSVSNAAVGQAYFGRDYLVATPQQSADDGQSAESETRNAWMQIVRFIDRALFVGVGLIYAGMIIMVLFIIW